MIDGDRDAGLIGQEPVDVELARASVHGVGSARADVHLAVRHRGHRKLYGVSGSVPGALRAIPKLITKIGGVVSVKNCRATTRGLIRAEHSSVWPKWKASARESQMTLRTD
jgi:hypothetical protein